MLELKDDFGICRACPIRSCGKKSCSLIKRALIGIPKPTFKEEKRYK